MSVTNRVLLVDDDKDLLEMVCLALESNKLNVSCVSDAEDVLSRAEKEKPDLVLMDIYLGNGDGRMLCSKIKSTPGMQDLPIILYSAGTIDPMSIQESKADFFIKKPFELSFLCDTIRSFIK